MQEYRKRLGLRVAGKARSQALELPLQLEAYVPQKLLLKDYQIEGGTADRHIVDACHHQQLHGVTH